MFRDFPAQNHTPCLGIFGGEKVTNFSGTPPFTILGEYPPPPPPPVFNVQENAIFIHEFSKTSVPWEGLSSRTDAATSDPARHREFATRTSPAGERNPPDPLARRTRSPATPAGAGWSASGTLRARAGRRKPAVDGEILKNDGLRSGKNSPKLLNGVAPERIFRLFVKMICSGAEI